jgi:hypothetical protein
MDVLVIGTSPYAMSSAGRLDAWIVEHLHSAGHKVDNLVTHHNTNFFPPEQTMQGPRWYYEFNGNKVLLFPINKGPQQAVPVYEIIQLLRPKLIITVGDMVDFLFMPTFRQSCGFEFKWLAVVCNNVTPMSREFSELIAQPDSMLCTNKFSMDFAKENDFHGPIDLAYSGCDQSKFGLLVQNSTCDDSNGRWPKLMTTGTNSQLDAIPSVIEAAALMRDEFPSLELYLHTNLELTGDFEFNDIRRRFDPKLQFIRTPTTFLSAYEGLSAEDYCQKINEMDLFMSLSMLSGTGMSLFESAQCGCMPIMSDCPAHREVAEILERESEGTIQASDVLVDGVGFYARHGIRLIASDPVDVAEKSKSLIRKLVQEKEGNRQVLKEATEKYGREHFVEALSGLVDQVAIAKASVPIETVGGHQHGCDR